jgi:hypothetical protein
LSLSLTLRLKRLLEQSRLSVSAAL